MKIDTAAAAEEKWEKLSLLGCLKNNKNPKGIAHD